MKMTDTTKVIVSIVSTRFGKIRVGESEKGLHEVQFVGKDDDLEGKFCGELAGQVASAIDKLAWDTANFPFYFEGTNCQKDVWNELIRIPIGTTITYTELAKRIGRPKAVRAVANACGRNRIAILVPCHRVVASNGKLGGYSCPLGISMKQRLLEAERNAAQKENLKNYC
ncbi:unnamed protein product, partial [Mesorhabditis belari]|uniref:Methylated-DNA--protein-cysteine methyltransferase n=1 Tax=Mesorhabditis belari TaxID=2138241 RepID=A0AAF3J969_9BILA